MSHGKPRDTGNCLATGHLPVGQCVLHILVEPTQHLVHQLLVPLARDMSVSPLSAQANRRARRGAQLFRPKDGDVTIEQMPVTSAIHKFLTF